jgi:hypothetical protein
MEYEMVDMGKWVFDKGFSNGMTPEAKQTAPQGQTKPAAAGPVSLGDLAPEIQEDIMSRRDAVYEMLADGASEKKIANAYKALNKLEESLGLDLCRLMISGWFLKKMAIQLFMMTCLHHLLPRIQFYLLLSVGCLQMFIQVHLMLGLLLEKVHSMHGYF